MLHGIRSLFDNDSRFVSYVTNSTRKLVQAEMKNMSSINQLKMLIEDMNP